MIYLPTDKRSFSSRGNEPADEPGYAIYDVVAHGVVADYSCELYTDDGKGNGDFLCAGELPQLQRIAHALEELDNEEKEIVRWQSRKSLTQG